MLRGDLTSREVLPGTDARQRDARYRLVTSHEQQPWVWRGAGREKRKRDASKGWVTSHSRHDVPQCDVRPSGLRNFPRSLAGKAGVARAMLDAEPGIVTLAAGCLVPV